MNAKDILNKFGFHAEDEPISIYAFSPVYRVTQPGGEYIIKKTQSPMLKANRLMAYTTSLKESGIDVVVPVSMTTDNPMAIDGAIYVVYPFIQGSTYSGLDSEIQEAGKLFGRIHALSSNENEFNLSPYDVYDFNEQEAEEGIQKITQNSSAYDIEISPKLEDRLMQAVHNQEDLNQAALPHVATPYDFKANNLIYTPDPYLIDPDNAGWVPRIFDLALVLLLFHNELETAPDQPFTSRQWKLFLTGYEESVVLSPKEKSYWPKAIEHVFLDEVMWLMADTPEDWHNSAQRKLFEKLVQLLMNVEEYDFI